MGFKIEHQEKEGDSFEVFMAGIMAESEEVERKMLKEAGEQVKERVIANLNRHRRAVDKRYKGRPAMADDVKVSTRRDRSGNLATRVKGGKMTGTLWHLLNDGTLHTQPTHFMDNALRLLDDSIDDTWDKVMK